jgi:RND family efflux transporter MFP subunit
MSETRIVDRALDAERPVQPVSRRGGRAAWTGLALLIVAGGALWYTHPWSSQPTQAAAVAAPPPPPVTVAKPLTATVASTTILLGQFAAVDSVELRAQVGGTLTNIAFKDGQIVHAGDPLFTIDPRPYQIELDQAVAQLATAQARQSLGVVETWRAQQLKKSDFGSAEVVDQRIADQRAADAAVETAKAAIRNAQLDLEFAHVTAPFTGRIGSHLVSVGNLVSGSRGGAGGATTLLATVVSLDPIYLNFDMSESDYAAYQKGHGGAAPHDDVAISLGGDGGKFTVHGTLDFIDNQVNRSSGTIRARATVPNHDLVLTPGQFARLQVPLGQAEPALLLPAAAVVPDQANQVVMTVAPDGTVVPKLVEIGGMYHGLRVIRSGLAATDTVVIDGLVRVRPGAKVTPQEGKVTETSTAGAAE